MLFPSLVTFVYLTFFPSSAYALKSVRVIPGNQLSTEAKALLTWKASVQNYSVAALRSWKLTSPTPSPNINSGSSTTTRAASSPTIPCKWFGITCNRAGSTVVQISLSEVELQGTLHNFTFSSQLHLFFFSESPLSESQLQWTHRSHNPAYW
ncbi:hypothetical protein NE237_018017 [Protea cynaroides]|uniref:Leucine-rich repeat-containing N-terminal plant-type domain-containing protein n=1 Tax=Protea cynaroides TaxID=273540 RepID=A0A9Q0K945_9MAGN|nr:hypothetical protein NE237_018017 [Protea cynaroides]